MSAPCKGYNPFHVQTMLAICESCPADVKQACLESAADAPFRMLEPQVWGGLVLPRDRALLPARTSPTTAEVEEDRRRPGRPVTPAGFGLDPASCGSGRVSASFSPAC